MNIDKVKEHFKNAKEVKCLYSGKIYNIESGFFSTFNESAWFDLLEFQHNDTTVLVYRNNEFAEIVTYKNSEGVSNDVTYSHYISLTDSLNQDIVPEHYKTNSIDVIDFCKMYNLNFNRGNIVKYVCRAGKKDDEIKDLKKALDYLQREIKHLENERK